LFVNQNPKKCLVKRVRVYQDMLAFHQVCLMSPNKIEKINALLGMIKHWIVQPG